jgi:hypothetical protein
MHDSEIIKLANWKNRVRTLIILQNVWQLNLAFLCGMPDKKVFNYKSG